MTRFHPRTLLIVLAACSASCGEDPYSADDYDDQNENVNTLDGGVPGGDGSVATDAGGSDAAPSGSPWNDASVQDAGSWDASQTADGGPGGNGDAGGTDAGRADAGGNDAGGGADAGPSCDTLTYETFGRQFMTDYCVGCHGAVLPRGNLSLNSLSAVVTRKANVKSAVLGGAMPQGTKKPSTAERERLGQWIDCGPR